MSSTLVAKTTTHTHPSPATATATTTSTPTYSHLARPQHGSQVAQPPLRSLRKATSHTNNRVTANNGASASTPNLNSLYNSHSQRFAPPPLPPLPPIPDSTTSSAGDVQSSRKGSLAAPTPSSLAAIPDASESYGLNTVLSHSSSETRKMAPATPGRGGAGAGAGAGAGDDFFVGDRVEVPGNMHGTVRFVGSVQGKKGTFAGVELHPDFAARGKNSGDVDG